MAATQRDASSPVPWPPIIYGGAAVVAGIVSWLSAWPFEPTAGWFFIRIAGVCLIFAGIALLMAAAAGFNRAKTPMPPTAPTKALVFGGIYRFTRNPMYLGMTSILAGLGLALDQLWFLIAVPLALFAVTKLAIEREEAYLARRFGAPYLEYKTKVRRWL